MMIVHQLMMRHAIGVCPNADARAVRQRRGRRDQSISAFLRQILSADRKR